MNTLTELIDSGTAKLAASGVPEPRREVASLLGFAMGKDRTFIIAHPEYAPSLADAKRFLEIIDRRAGREPFHYITGTKEFFGLDFKVSPAVLIPRPETEMLVEQAVEFLAERPNPEFCEVGVGSGCISIAVLVNCLDATAKGLEKSAAAIEVADQNARIHGVDKRFDIRESDLFSRLNTSEKFDLIVSNPPYISIDEFAVLEPDVRKFEPEMALTDGGDGLSIIREIVSEAPRFLRPGGRLALEIGHDQSDRVVRLFEKSHWTAIETHKDLQGIDRTISAAVNT